MYRDILKNKTVAIVGCGGLGGYVIEELSRAGIGRLILIDKDVFCESNMNRQLLALCDTIGKFKTQTYKGWLKKQSKTKCDCYEEFFGEQNADIINDADIVVDCVDNVKSRQVIAKECKKRNKIFVHGAIDGEQGQILVCFPDDKNIEKLFESQKDVEHKTISYVVATTASIQASFVVKALTDKADALKNKLVLVDMENFETRKMEI